jgi:hypothetical protein
MLVDEAQETRWTLKGRLESTRAGRRGMRMTNIKKSDEDLIRETGGVQEGKWVGALLVPIRNNSKVKPLIMNN